MKRIVFLLLVQIAMIISLCFVGCNAYEVIETTDIEDYGKFTETKYGEKIDIYTEKVMPKKIEEFFSNVEYSYKMCHSPAMHEAYLKVTIDSEKQYESYINSIVGDNETEAFYYDKTYREYVIVDKISLQHENEEKGPTIGYTEIQKILFSNETNTLIFISLVVPYNDMPFFVDTFLYFEKFDINPSCYYNGERLI